ncbi:NAD(P)/FAD-dependent oxidoreductase [Rhodothermus bifroesti]|uniref:FAD-binding oxidoreductase n=1 Tax=Rhodothermus marinus TaxID=29549 RepID=A0A7V2AZZ6_RHOMR|nr:FAD-dependent oxidoreductase [Rhodothermus bifroesti]GBD02569.1 tRNA 5-methylaminomethyl-2-thiouridine biosynthesis bifunctional protein MnmC [bacterium HR18]
MQASPRIAVVGAGLAGACAAFALAPYATVTVFEASSSQAEAFRAQGGLVHPLMTRRARPNWRHEEALQALERLLEATGVRVQRGLLRVAFEARQYTDFQEAARRYPQWASWLAPEAVRDHFPQVHAPYGALWIPSGLLVPVATLIQSLLAHAGVPVHRGVEILDWQETATEVVLQAANGAAYTFDYVVLAPGYGYVRHPELARLPLQGVKGQAIALSSLPELGHLPPVVANVHVVFGPDHLHVGSSYELTFSSLAPSPAQSLQLQEQAAYWVPAIARATFKEAWVGVRVIRPLQPLPVLSPLPSRRRVWLFSALGSRGLLFAPLLASWLPKVLFEPERLPPEVRLTRA